MDLGQPQRVEAEPVGLDRFGHQLAIARGRALRVRRRQLVEEVEFHSMAPDVQYPPSAATRSRW